MDSNRLRKGIFYDEERLYEDCKLSIQHVYYNDKLIGTITKRYQLDKKTKLIDTNVYDKHVFTSIGLTNSEAMDISNEYKLFTLPDKEYWSLFIDLQTESEYFELEPIVKRIHDIFYGEVDLSLVENNFINELNTLISRYSSFLEFKFDINNGKESTIKFQLLK